MRKNPYSNKGKALDTWIYKVDMNGIQKLKKKLSTGKNQLNVWQFDPSSGTLTWDDTTDTLAWVLPRKQLVASAVNAQRSIAVLLNASTFEIIENKGLLSPESFNNDMIMYKRADNKTEFCSVEYVQTTSRELRVHRMDSISKTSAVSSIK